MSKLIKHKVKELVILLSTQILHKRIKLFRNFKLLKLQEQSNQSQPILQRDLKVHMRKVQKLLFKD